MVDQDSHFDKEKFGEMIREKRGKTKMSMAKLAEKCDASTRYIYDVEHGRTEPRVGKAILICRACGITFEELSNLTSDVETEEYSR